MSRLLVRSGVAAALLFAPACLVDFDQSEPLSGTTSSSGTAGQGGAAVTTGVGTSQGGGSTGGGNAGGAGGGVVGDCGTTDNVGNDFATASPGPFYVTQGPGATVTQGGGELVFTLPALTASWSGYSSYYGYDLRAHALTMEVAEVANPSTTAESFVVLAADGGNYLALSSRAGELIASRALGGSWSQLASVPFDAVQHRVWRVREASGTVFWESSPDGMSWSTLASVPLSSLFSVETLFVEFGGRTEGSEPNPGQVRFSSLNGGNPAGVTWCPMSELSDDFDDGELADQWAATYQQAGCTVSEVGGGIVMDFDGASATDCVLIPARPYDMRADGVSVEVQGVAQGATSHYAYMRAEIDANNGFEFLYFGTELSAKVEVGGGANTIFSASYSPTQHRWWRIREDVDTILWEVSADGITWSSFASSANPLDASALRPIVGAGMNSAEAGTFAFDNLNRAPGG